MSGSCVCVLHERSLGLSSAVKLCASKGGEGGEDDVLWLN